MKRDKRTKEYKQWLKDNPGNITLSPENINEVIDSAKKAIESPYKATLKIGNETFVGEGETVMDAVEAINPKDIKTLSYLTVEHGDKKAELRFGVINAKRLFSNKLSREIKCEQFRRLLI